MPGRPSISSSTSGGNNSGASSSDEDVCDDPSGSLLVSCPLTTDAFQLQQNGSSHRDLFDCCALDEEEYEPRFFTYRRLSAPPTSSYPCSVLPGYNGRAFGSSRANDGTSSQVTTGFATGDSINNTPHKLAHTPSSDVVDRCMIKDAREMSPDDEPSSPLEPERSPVPLQEEDRLVSLVSSREAVNLEEQRDSAKKADLEKNDGSVGEEQHTEPEQTITSEENAHVDLLHTLDSATTEANAPPNPRRAAAATGPRAATGDPSDASTGAGEIEREEEASGGEQDQGSTSTASGIVSGLSSAHASPCASAIASRSVSSGSAHAINADGGDIHGDDSPRQSASGVTSASRTVQLLNEHAEENNSKNEMQKKVVDADSNANALLDRQVGKVKNDANVGASSNSKSVQVTGENYVDGSSNNLDNAHGHVMSPSSPTSLTSLVSPTSISSTGSSNSEDEMVELWNPSLYTLQCQAPKPKCITCTDEVSNRPSQFGNEYHGHLSKRKATEMLGDREGSYLVRTTSTGETALSFFLEGRMYTYQLHYEEGLFFVGESRFPNVEDLVADGLIALYLQNHNAMDAMRKGQEQQVMVQRKRSHRLQRRPCRRLKGSSRPRLGSSSNNNNNSNSNYTESLFSSNSSISSSASFSHSATSPARQKQRDVSSSSQHSGDSTTNESEGVGAASSSTADNVAVGSSDSGGGLDESDLDFTGRTRCSTTGSSATTNITAASTKKRASAPNILRSISAGTAEEKSVNVIDDNEDSKYSSGGGASVYSRSGSRKSDGDIKLNRSLDMPNLKTRRTASSQHLREVGAGGEGGEGGGLRQRRSSAITALRELARSENEKNLSEESLKVIQDLRKLATAAPPTGENTPRVGVASGQGQQLQQQVRLASNRKRDKLAYSYANHHHGHHSHHHGNHEGGGFLFRKHKYGGSSGTLPLTKTASGSSLVYKAHKFHIHNYIGLQWCEVCHHFLWGLSQQGMRCQDCGMDIHKHCLNLAMEDECTPNRKMVKRVFGVDLTTVVKMNGGDLPQVIEECVAAIEQRDLKEEGLYRVSGHNTEIIEVKEKYNEGEKVDFSQYIDTNILTGAVKLYLRELPIPVITFDAYGQILKAAAEVKDSRVRNTEEDLQNLSLLSSTLKLLPMAHYNLLRHIMEHLHRIECLSNENKMTAHNLAVVFSPTLMRAPSDDFLLVKDYPLQHHLVECLILNHHYLFPQT